MNRLYISHSPFVSWGHPVGVFFCHLHESTCSEWVYTASYYATRAGCGWMPRWDAVQLFTPSSLPRSLIASPSSVSRQPCTQKSSIPSTIPPLPSLPSPLPSPHPVYFHPFSDLSSPSLFFFTSFLFLPLLSLSLSPSTTTSPFHPSFPLFSSSPSLPPSSFFPSLPLPSPSLCLTPLPSYLGILQ